MARNRDPFTQALSSLRERIESGRIAGGAPVIVQDEAERLGLSTTPVREALARLSGEGLVERAETGGYRAMRLDAQSIGDRYALQAEHLAFAIRLCARAVDRPLPGRLPGFPGSPERTVRALFGLVVCSAGNAALWDGWSRMQRQLDVVCRLEPLLFADLPEEAQRLSEAFVDSRTGAFGEACLRFHARRIAAAGPLAALAAITQASAGRERDQTERPEQT